MHQRYDYVIGHEIVGQSIILLPFHTSRKTGICSEKKKELKQNSGMLTGTVAKVGKAVKSFKSGDKVVSCFWRENDYMITIPCVCVFRLLFNSVYRSYRLRCLAEHASTVNGKPEIAFYYYYFTSERCYSESIFLLH
jgi:hypothetical protein